MKQVLKKYHVVLKTIGPVFIGSGKEINKKEYLFSKDSKKVGILNTATFYGYLKEKGKSSVFEDYLLRQNDNLETWLDRSGISSDEVSHYIQYWADCGDAIAERGKGMQVMEFVKDPYGMPYVPGSTLKGIFRTILLSEDIFKRPEYYSTERTEIDRSVSEGDLDSKGKKDKLLKRECEDIESKMFRTLDREDYSRDQRKKPKWNDAVNDIMQGFIVSDSSPLRTEDLVFCQKWDRHTDGTDKKLPLLRECLKPGVNIEFELTLDTSVCKIDKKDIMDAVSRFNELYWDSFAKKFPDIDRMTDNQVLLGGGVGFVSKTVICPLFGSSKGVGITQNILRKTWSAMDFQKHKHYEDSKSGVSPHICKMTKYQGNFLPIGLCEISFN